MLASVHGSLCGEVDAPVSKSDLHRLILACSLSKGRTIIKRCTLSQDILATAGALQAMGAKIEFGEDEIIVDGISDKSESSIECDCSESGSTLRFLVPVAAALGRQAVFTGRGKLPQRPMQPLVSELSAHGIDITLPNDGASLPMSISGRLSGGSFTFSGDISSQYITGLMFALPLLCEDSRIILTSPLQSQGYVDMTLSVLKRFGIRIDKTENGWSIPGRQSYSSPGELTAQGDWSNAAFWICAGALSQGDGITTRGIDISSLQGDRAVCEILSRMGADITINPNSVVSRSSRLRSTVIDASQIPDIIPILSVAAAVADGETQIINAERLRIKESDRLHAMYDCLSSIGADITELDDGLIIRGKPHLNGGKVSSYGDHRIAMSMSVASLVCEEPVIIDDPMCVTKSYPDFYEDFKMLGGEVNVIDLGK